MQAVAEAGINRWKKESCIRSLHEQMAKEAARKACMSRWQKKMHEKPE